MGMARYFSTDQNGITLVEPDEMAMRLVLIQLVEEGEDADYPDVSLTHESGLSLTVGLNWVVVLEREASEDDLHYLKRNSLEDVLALWLDLAAGHLERLEEEYEWTRSD